MDALIHALCVSDLVISCSLRVLVDADMFIFL